MVFRNFPDVAFLHFPVLCLQGNLKCLSLQSAPSLGGGGHYSREICVGFYMIAYHLLSDKLLVCQAFVRYSIFIVTGDINPNSVLKANLEENLCLTFIYT